MKSRFTPAALCAALLALPAIAAADQLPVQDFARHAQLSMPSLSPDGTYFAVRLDNGSSHALVVYRVADTSHPVSLLRMPHYEVPLSIYWVGPTRLVVEKGKEFGSIDKPFSTGEILATDVDGKHQDYLYGYQGDTYGNRAATRNTDEGWGSVAGLPEHANGHFYLASESWKEGHQSSLYDVDATRSVRHLIGDIGVPGMSFLVGPDGMARYAFGRDNDYNYVVYQMRNGGWSQTSGSFAPLYFAPDHQHVFASYAVDNGPASLVALQAFLEKHIGKGA